MTNTAFEAIKILSLAIGASIIAILIGNFLVKYLYKIKFWKKEARAKTIDGKDAEVFLSLHKERETTVPRGGGLVIWVTVLILILLGLLLDK